MFGIDTDDFSFAVASIFLKITGIWTSKNRIEHCFRTFAAYYTIFMVALCIFVQSLDLIRGDHDPGTVLYALVNVLCTSNDLFKMFVLFVYKKDFLNLVVHLQRQFLESHYDTNERTILDACRSTCAIFIGFFTVFTHVTLVGYVLGPLFVSIGKNASDRIFPFALPPEPFCITPYYEITFFVQYRLSNLKCENVLDDSVTRVPSAAENSYITFRRCVQRHQMLIEYCNKLEDVFSVIVFAQVFIFSVLICLSGLQILLATTVGRRYTAVFFIMTSFIQLLMFTYSCDGLIQESLNIAPAVYSSPWTCLPMSKYGKMLRKDVVLVIMRSRTPCCLTAKGFFPISLETYTKVWSTAASYFTLLRQTMDDLENS